MNLKQKFQKAFPDITFDEPLKPYSTFKIGGPADFFYRLRDKNTLPELLAFARANKIPYLFMGAGSNILFDDKGFRGLVIRNECDKMEIITGDTSAIIADSGLLISKLIAFTLEKGFSGLENWSGIPGTVGGAVYGNAGCNNLESKDILIRATIFNPKTGKIREVRAPYFQYKYRHSRIKKTGEIILDATFSLKKAKLSPAKQQQILDEMRSLRLSKQPLGFTAGSFFKNPSPHNPAGMLIDTAGLKGKIIGKAQISPKHGNFFMNLGNAHSKDIIALARLAKRTVKAKFGITLEPEVQIFGQTKKLKL